jgi:transcriptional regulator with XRE-family HTH domain/DNA-binding transcriptional MerR regulator
MTCYAMGRRLRASRLSANLTQGELAERAGCVADCAFTTISGIENGRSWPSVALAKRLADALGQKPEAIFGEPHRCECGPGCKALTYSRFAESHAAAVAKRAQTEGVERKRKRYRYLTAEEVANAAGCRPTTVRKYAWQGRLRSARKSPGRTGRWLFTKSAVEEVKQLLAHGKEQSRLASIRNAIERWSSPAAREEQSVRSREFWSSPAGEELRQMMWPVPGRVEVRCAVCGRAFETKRYRAREAAELHRRQFCDACYPLWSRALWDARHAATAQGVLTAFDQAYAVGVRFEKAVLKHWPTKLGRRPPLALDVAIEALFCWRGSTDAEIRYIVQSALDRNENPLRIPGVKPGQELNPRYVTRRREEAGIRRRAA